MKLIVNPHKIEIEKSPVNEKEINVTECEFEFSEEITQDFVKDVYFTLGNTTIKMANIQNNKCDIPNEVLTQKGTIEIGVVAYLVENEEEIKRYNPSPAYFNSWVGSLKSNAQNTEPVTPTDKEQMEQALNDMEIKIDNLDIDAEKVGSTATITITKKDGTQETILIEDGIDGTDGADFEYNWIGTSLGVKTSEEQEYQYVNLKGDTGEPGQIEFIIVNELPQTGVEGTIYLIPLEEPDTQKNNYAEYIWVNDDWELLGKIGVHVNLTNYYTKQEVNNLIPTALSELSDDSTHRLVSDTEKTTWNSKISATDYPNGNHAGVIKATNDYAIQVTQNGNLQAQTKGYSDYLNAYNSMFIGKGTLENVIKDKGLVSNTDYANDNTGGVIKTGGFGGSARQSSTGVLYATIKTYNEYVSTSSNVFISKGTLENVITGKNLETANNKVTSISSNSTDTEYPSAKCVYDSQEEQNTIIENQANEIEYLNSVIEQAFDEITDEDTEITLNNTIQAKMKMELKGNTEQDSYTGKNLLDIQYFENGSINATTGQNISNNQNGRGNNYIQVLPNTTYTLSCNTNINNLRLSEYASDKTYIQRDVINDNKVLTITTTANTYYLRWSLNYDNSTIVTQTIIDNLNLQLESGSTSTDWEPYVGGTPSPNPHYPQDIRVVTGNNSVKVENNVFDITTITENIYINENGIIGASSVTNLSDYISIESSTNYTLSYDYSTLLNSNQRNFGYYDENKTYISGWIYSPSDKTHTITTPNNAKYLRFSYDKNVSNIRFSTESQTYPINLGTIELCKIGNYQDYIYKENGKWYKHSEIGKVVLDGSEQCNFNTTKTITQVFEVVSPLPNKLSNNYTILNNYFIFNNPGDTEKISLDVTAAIDVYIAINKTTASTVAEFKNWLSTHNVTIYYILATPTNEEITDTTLISQLNAIENAVSYKTQTNISQTNANLSFILYASALGKNQ